MGKKKESKTIVFNLGDKKKDLVSAMKNKKKKRFTLSTGTELFITETTYRISLNGTYRIRMIQEEI